MCKKTGRVVQIRPVIVRNSNSITESLSGNGAQILHDNHLVVVGKAIKRNSHHRSIGLFQTNNAGRSLFDKASFDGILSSAVSPSLESKQIVNVVFGRRFSLFFSRSSVVSGRSGVIVSGGSSVVSSRSGIVSVVIEQISSVSVISEWYCFASRKARATIVSKCPCRHSDSSDPKERPPTG